MQEIIPRKEAKERGLKWYFTGKPCKYGHIDKRQTTNGMCSECRRIKDVEKYHFNIESGRRKSLQNYYANRDKRIASMRNYYAENTQKEKTRNHEYIINHKSELRIKWRNQRIQNKEKIKHYNKLYSIKNKDKVVANQSRRRCRKLKSDSHHTEEDIKELYRAQKGRCAYCQTDVGERYHVDHIIPLSKGGDNSKYNIQICCPSCNLRKHAKDPIDFAQELGLLI